MLQKQLLAEQERERREKEAREEAARLKEESKRNAREKIKAHLENLQEETAKLTQARDLLVKRKQLRKRNMEPERPDEDQLTLLDSGLKKNTALYKKLRQINEETKTQILQDIKKTNQTKYVSEASAAIAEVNFKQKDVAAVSEVCSVLHERYEEFSPSLLPLLHRLMQPSEEKSVTVTKRRNTLRLILELFLIGVHSNLELINAIVSKLVKEGLAVAGDNENDKCTATQSQLQNSLALLATFAKHSKDEILGMSSVALSPSSVAIPPEESDFELIATAGGEGNGMKEEDTQAPSKGDLELAKGSFDAAVAALAEESKDNKILKANQQKHFYGLIEEGYKVGLDHLFQQCKDLRKMESDNQKTIHTKGELSEQQLAQYEAARKSFDSSQRNVVSLSESLEKEMPPLPQEEVTQMEVVNIVVAKGFGSGQEQEGGAFDDEETRAFYEDLPNLCAQLPTVLVSSSSAAATSNNEEGGGGAEPVKGEAAPAPAQDSNNNSDVEQLRSDQQLRLDDLFSQLQTSVNNREAADKISLEFCYLNLKSVRKRVVKALFSCPRQRLELLPYYSRIAAILTKVHPEVGPSLCKMLEDEFESLVTKKYKNLDETRIRNVRFLGELTKFKLLPFSVVFAFLKVLLDDFALSSIDALAALLESTGRFLFRTPETAVRMSNILDVMMRLKNAKNLDPRQNTLIENAFYSSRPPEKSIDKEEVPPLHQYIEHLIFAKLSPSNVTQVLRQCRKLPLMEVSDFLLSTLLNVRCVKVSCIPALASLVSSLSNYHENIAIDFVDAVLEEIQVGLEQDDFTQHQHRVSVMILLGEMSNIRFVDSNIIFNVLYLVLFHSSKSRGRNSEVSDLFRARLILVLLNTCGKTLNRKITVRKVDMFLLYYQQFLLAFQYIPYELSYDVQEMFKRLKPKMALFKTFDEARALLAAIQQERPEDPLSFTIKWFSRKSMSEAEIRESAELQQDQDSLSEEESDDSDEDSNMMGEESDVESISDNEDMEDRKEEEEEAVDEMSMSSSSSVSGSDLDDSDTGYDSESDESEDEVISFKQNLDHLKPSKEEEDNLEKEFQQLMQESLGTAKLAPKASNMSLPAANRAIINRFSQGGSSTAPESSNEPNQRTAAGEAAASNTIQFHVMIKKGTKSAVRDIQVPKAAVIAQANETRQAAEAQERDEIKRLVLQASERDEEAAAAARGQRQPTKKYQVAFPKVKSRERW
jgi:regulator of nonsense transcripts 2